jgi:hypothetical protein
LPQEFFGPVYHDLILKTKHLKTERPQHRITRNILRHHLGCFVNLSVQFDVDLVFRAKEVCDVIVDLMFTSELQALEASIP